MIDCVYTDCELVAGRLYVSYTDDSLTFTVPVVTADRRIVLSTGPLLRLRFAHVGRESQVFTEARRVRTSGLQ